MKILAVDYGDSRTGLATCDRTEFLTTAITPQITLKARNKVAARVCEVAKELGAELIVIGLPLNMDGTAERPAGTLVGRAAVHLRRPRQSGRKRHLWHKAQGDPGFGQRYRHSGRLSCMAEGTSGGDIRKRTPDGVLFLIRTA